MSGHRNYLEICILALENNLKAIKSMVADECQFMAIVKGNAWGAGTLECAKAFVHAGADWIGVTTVEDAALIRQAVDLPILLICEPPRGAIADIIGLDIDITVYSVETARLISRAARKHGCVVNVHIKINTGLNRVGIPVENTCEFFNEIKQFDNLEIAGIFSHFASADELSSSDQSCKEHAYVKCRNELGLFKTAVEDIKHRSGWSGIVHMANTGATVFFPESHLDMVRVSTGLMGLSVEKAYADVLNFQQVYSWKTEVSHVIHLNKGDSVGYTSPYKCPADTTIATLSIGWGDGLSRAFLNGGHVLIRGSLYPIVTMSMDMTTVDLKERKDDMLVGEEVVIFGEQQGQILEPMAQGARIGMAADAILTVISERVPRIYNR